MIPGDNVQWLPLGAVKAKTGKIVSINDEGIAEVRTNAWVRHQDRNIPRTVPVPLSLLTKLRPVFDTLQQAE